MRLHKLLSKISIEPRTESTGKQTNPEIVSLEYDSRRVSRSALFFAIQGQVTNGHLYLKQALQKGAVAVASEQAAPSDFPVPWVQVPAIRPFMASAADHFYGQPSKQLQLVGITGTNGKTTTASLGHSVLSQRSPALLMGTIKMVMGNTEAESERTTPEAIDIQRTLLQALRQGCRLGAVEVSSHALFLHRVYQCCFPVAVFTNLTQDHLDFHKTLEHYFQAKSLLFQPDYNPGIKYAVLNADDPFSERISLPAIVRSVTFGSSPDCDVYPLFHHTSIEGTVMDLSFFGRKLNLRSSLAGEHNLYNIMAAATASSLLGISDRQIQEGVAKLLGVPGRFEKVEVPQPFSVFVDYAHTPHALKNVLGLCRSLTGNRIICVFGCGGDRDPGKRPLMGELVMRHCDLAIITTDNPRWEAPEKIIEEIRAGIPATDSQYETIVDRKEAIVRALHLARAGDIVLVAGKGHETYQEAQGRRTHFDDREVVRERF